MQSQILVVSNPPHRDVDHEAVSSILGLELDNARLKMGFAAPEVLSASDPDRAAELAGVLETAGVNVAVINGHDLTKAPWPTLVTSFEFGRQGLFARSGDDVVEVRYDRPVAGVYCVPPPEFPKGGPDRLAPTVGLESGAEGLAIAETIEWIARLDLYFTQGSDLRRISIAEDVTDFSGLGDGTESAIPHGLAATLAECEKRFGNLHVDARLEGVRPRQRFIAGDTGFDMDLRKAFSFGTLLLRQVLDSISPELRDVPQYEYGSRLSYTINHGVGRGPVD